MNGGIPILSGTTLRYAEQLFNKVLDFSNRNLQFVNLSAVLFNSFALPRHKNRCVPGQRHKPSVERFPVIQVNRFEDLFESFEACSIEHPFSQETKKTVVRSPLFLQEFNNLLNVHHNSSMPQDSRRLDLVHIRLLAFDESERLRRNEVFDQDLLISPSPV